jgi:hypothetical protein
MLHNCQSTYSQAVQQGAGHTIGAAVLPQELLASLQQITTPLQGSNTNCGQNKSCG